MGTALTATRFSIDIPADAAYLGTVRLFASSIARHYGVQDEGIEDLKMAVTEACSAFLRYEERDRGSLHVEVAASKDRLAFEITSPDLSIPAPRSVADTPTPRGVAAGLGMDLLRILLEDSEVVAGDRSAIRFSVPLDAAGPAIT
jgi:anti-sigma regulatory factor (Ser/Thr protein kinase)